MSDNTNNGFPVPEEPLTREEEYLSAIAGVTASTEIPEKPLTRVEAYLDKIVENGGGGGGGGFTPTDAQLDAMNSGITSEDVEQISTNKDNISTIQTSLEVGQNDDGKVLTATYSGGTGTYSWVTPSGGGGTSDYTDLTNKPQINGITLNGNKSLANLGIAAAVDIPTLVSGLNTTGTVKNGSSVTSATGYTASPIISGIPYYKDTTYESKSAASGGTAVSLCTTGEKYTWNNKQSALTTAQLNAVNSGIDITKVAQIETNKDNILTAQTLINWNCLNGVKNVLDVGADRTGQESGTLTYTVSRGVYTFNGTPTSNTFVNIEFTGVSGEFVLTGCPANGSDNTYMCRIFSTDGTAAAAYDYGNGSEPYNYNPNVTYRFTIKIKQGYSATDLVFMPMLRPVGTNTNFIRYAPSNLELYELIQQIQSQLNS